MDNPELILTADQEASMMGNPLTFLPFLIIMVIFAFLYMSGKKKYQEFVDALDKKEYSLKDFFPVGFMLMDMIHYQYNSNFDRSLRRQLRELYPEEYVEFYLRVTYAQAASTGLLGLLLGSLFFGVMDGDFTMLIVGLAFAGILLWVTFNSVTQKINERHSAIALDLPELTNQILILSGAGLTIKGALKKIADEMPATGPLYTALKTAVEKMNLGKTDEEALDEMTLTCNTPEVRRFVSVILMNIDRGGSEVLIALNEIGKELWDARRAAAQRIAEETSTKLLFPMMLMLFAVILLVAAPAVMGMGI